MPRKGRKRKRGGKKKEQNVNIFARVRNLMPWEPRKTIFTPFTERDSAFVLWTFCGHTKGSSCFRNTCKGRYGRFSECRGKRHRKQTKQSRGHQNRAFSSSISSQRQKVPSIQFGNESFESDLRSQRREWNLTTNNQNVEDGTYHR